MSEYTALTFERDELRKTLDATLEMFVVHLKRLHRVIAAAQEVVDMEDERGWADNYLWGQLRDALEEARRA